MTYRRIETDPCTHRKPILLFTAFDHPEIHFPLLRTPPYTFPRFLRIGRDLQRTGKIIAGSGRNISEHNFAAVQYPIDHLIHRTVSAQRNDQMLLSVCCHFRRKLLRLSRILRASGFKIDPVVLQDLF